MKRITFLLLAFVALTLAPLTAAAQNKPSARLFWQDDSKATILFGDLHKTGEQWSLEPQPIKDFPKIDVTQQSLVQMQVDAGMLLAGVRQSSDDGPGSGWVAIDTGLVEEPHGDHSHWRLENSPSVVSSMIGAGQGNPAHVYRYGSSFVIANDSKNGFSITSPSRLRSADTPAAAMEFHGGGNGHITLAVHENRVAYSTWIAREGEDAGRVDVVGLGDNAGKSYAIRCPSGGLHGATINSGKVFLAPVDGICWVNADLDVTADPATVQVQHLSLGADAAGKPLRTGAFANLGSLVLCTAGAEQHAKLCLIDAASGEPRLTELPIELAAGEKLMTPVGARLESGKRLALMLRESPATPENDALIVATLDPNNDGAVDDATVTHVIKVGRNKVTGHAGHHGITLLPNKDTVVISNPGDGTISIISLVDFEIESTIKVDGTPTRLEAVVAR